MMNIFKIFLFPRYNFTKLIRPFIRYCFVTLFLSSIFLSVIAESYYHIVNIEINDTKETEEKTDTEDKLEKEEKLIVDLLGIGECLLIKKLKTVQFLNIDRKVSTNNLKTVDIPPEILA